MYCYFHGCKNDNFQMKTCGIFLIFAQNIDCGHMLEPPYFEVVLTSTKNLCFATELRNQMYTPVLKSDVQNRVLITEAC